ncbi:nucleotidyltransferase family protein [Streptomyces sp. NPDC048254]|uniref:nucleotidyltransferase family protein n=1 Tax=Streptomyces sp. NPDC048254 TaxID=3365525 RepID=UPI003715E641
MRALQVAELARLAEAFDTQGLEWIAYKGVVLDHLVDNLDIPSLSNDIDVLVRRVRLAETRKLLESLGYRTELRIDSGRVRQLPARISRMTEESVYLFGQCAPYDRLVAVPELRDEADRVRELMPTQFCVLDGELHFKLSIDLHYSLNLLTDDIGTRVKPAEPVWWEQLQWVGVGGTEVPTLADRVLSWVLLHRLYVDCLVLGTAGVKGLSNVKLLHRAGRLDVPHVRDTARKFPYLGPSLLYSLRAADQICALGLDPDIDLAAVRGTVAPLMNAGDCLPALLDFGLDLRLGPLGADAADAVTARTF